MTQIAETAEMKDLRAARPFRPPASAPATERPRPRHWTVELRNPLISVRVVADTEAGWTCAWCGCDSKRVAYLDAHRETAVCDLCIRDAKLMLDHTAP